MSTTPEKPKYNNANTLILPLLREMDPRSIIFSEVNVNQIILYVLHQGSIKLFLVSIKDNHTFQETFKFLEKCEYLDHFGLIQDIHDRYSDTYHIFVRQFVKLATDPDRAAFVFFFGTKKFLLECSSKSVFDQASSLIARRRTLNTQLFSANFFLHHHYTAPILDAYFGKIGFEYFKEKIGGRRNLVPPTFITNLDQPEHNTPLSLHSASTRTTPSSFDTLLSELNRIPPEELSHPDLSIELEYQTDFSIYDSYIHHFFVDPVEEYFALLILNDLAGHPVEITPVDFDRAVTIIRYEQNQIFNLSPNQLIEGRRSLKKYQAKYLLSHISRDQLKDFIDYFFDLDYLPEHIGQFTSHLVSLAGVSLYEKFSKIEVKTPSKFTDFTKLCEYPAVIYLSSATRKSLIKKILDDKLSPIETHLFLINCMHTTSETNFADLLPALLHLVTTTSDPELFSTLHALFCTIRLYLTPDQFPAYDKLLYTALWPRIGGVWPLQHLEDFDFANSDQRDIFARAISILASCRTLPQLDPDYKKFINNLNQQYKDGDIDYDDLPYSLARQLFYLRTAKSRPDGIYHAACDNFSEPEAIDLLSHPNSIKDIEVIIKDVFMTDVNECYIHNYVALFEQILIYPRPIDISTYLLEYITKNLVHFLLTLDATDGYDITDAFTEDFDQLINLFTAACTGASHPDELPLLQKFSDRVITLQDSTLPAATKPLRAHRQELITAALNLAKRNIKDVTTQRQNLAKII